MSDDQMNNNLNSIDKEPASGTAWNSDVEEHVDLKHRIEADPHHETGSRMTATSATVPATELPKPGPGTLVLQWLVYAFWGWTALAFGILVLTVVDYIISQTNDGFGRSYWFDEGIAYPLSAAIVLFLISLISDIFYARTERRHARSNGSNVIMIIHAVLFALFGIGALIMSVFGAVNLLIGESNEDSGALVSIISGFIIFIIYGMTFLRTLRPSRLKWLTVAYWAFMSVVLVATVILGIIGPAAQARLRAQDQVIENALPSIATGINEYANQNGTLPESLKDVDTIGVKSADVSSLIDENKIEYNPGEKIGVAPDYPQFELSQVGVDQLGVTERPIYHYQLCVTYLTDDGYDSDAYDSKPEGQRYYVGVNTIGHDAGRTCYDAQTDYSN